MPKNKQLAEFLKTHAKGRAHADAVNATIVNLAQAAVTLSASIADGSIHEDIGASGAANVQGEVQKHLDVVANDAFVAAAKRSPVAFLLSEEQDEIVAVNAGAPLGLAFDPLDGSSNISINSMIGSIFSIVAAWSSGEATFQQSGSHQLAAGYVIYGAQTQLVITVGEGTHMFTLDRRKGEFIKTHTAQIPSNSSEFAINASNYRHWDKGYRDFVDLCLDGKAGELGSDYNMRWLAALVGEAHRILMRGGIFMYPADQRKGYERGRLRLLYECAPISMLVEQAGGAATDGVTRILDIAADEPHARTGFCFGSKSQVRELSRCLDETRLPKSPLFGSRGLFTA